MALPRLVVNLRDPRPIFSLPDWAEAEIRDAADDRFEVVVVGSPADGRGDGGRVSEEAIEATRGAEVHIGYGFPRELFDAVSNGTELKWVHTASAGVGGSLYPEMVSSPITLTNSAGIHAQPVADSILASVLYFARGLDIARAAQTNREWSSASFSAADTPLHELLGTRIGILGYGGIGKAAGRRARSLGMNVVGYKRRSAEEADVEIATGPAGLERILRESRYVVLCLPHTADTEQILNAETIGWLRPDAVVINVGRGELIEEDALIDALTSGRIRGAALDVFCTEPLPGDSRFWGFDNVLITPHITATTGGFWEREIKLVIENIRRYIDGDPLLNTVDKKAGY